MIYQHIRKNKKKLGHVRIVSFLTSSDGKPIEDVTNMLETMKDQVEAYDPNIWMIAKGDPKKLYNITHNGESLLKKGAAYYGGNAFQELMLLVDKENHLRMVLNGKTEGMVRGMKQHLALLDKQYDKNAKKNKK
jgi:hypothetical protein